MKLLKYTTANKLPILNNNILNHTMRNVQIWRNNNNNKN